LDILRFITMMAVQIAARRNFQVHAYGCAEHLVLTEKQIRHYYYIFLM
jgi:hypothetical protein